MSLLAAALALALASPAASPEFAGAQFERVDHLRNLPPFMSAALKATLHGEAIANTDAPFDSTHALSGDGRPQRRFIFAGRSANTWFVYYEHGGRGNHRHILVFTANGERAHLRENLVLTARPESVQALQEAVRAGQASAARDR
jgi:hypothetical protein